MLKVKLLVMLLLMVVVSGCSTAIKQSDLFSGEEKTIEPPADKAMVVVYRDIGGMMVASTDVYMDGKKVASLMYKEKSYFLAEPGYHKFIALDGSLPSLFTHPVVEGEIEAGGIYYMGFSYSQNSFFKGPGYTQDILLATMGEEEKGVFGNLKLTNLVMFNVKNGSIVTEEHKDDIKEEMADAEEEWADTPKDERSYLRKSKRINEIEWYIDGDKSKRVYPTLPYGNL